MHPLKEYLSCLENQNVWFPFLHICSCFDLKGQIFFSSLIPIFGIFIRYGDPTKYQTLGFQTPCKEVWRGAPKNIPIKHRTWGMTGRLGKEPKETHKIGTIIIHPWNCTAWTPKLVDRRGFAFSTKAFSISKSFLPSIFGKNPEN